MGPKRENLYSGLSNAAWGYFFIHFDFNLGTVSIFPRFVGFLLLLSACGKLSAERRDLSLLRPLAMLLAGWNALDWLASWVGQDVDGHILFLDLLVTTAQLYFHFQFLTDMAAIAERYQSRNDCLGQSLRNRRTVYIVLITVIALVQDLPAGLLGEWMEWVVLALAVIVCIAAVLIMTGLFGLRRCIETMVVKPDA